MRYNLDMTNECLLITKSKCAYYLTPTYINFLTERFSNGYEQVKRYLKYDKIKPQKELK